ncbi:MAG: uroporphyrinogen-III C-methyltransferase [Acidobacteria bacterium RIFCSPLOWO2_02_FULL_68_18]|nr:MAG: uroporphyrinogen-III C-methyltransferase [Acidobacteria bacterium RIFCSPLOWO2_02_FULL_68_18]
MSDPGSRVADLERGARVSLVGAGPGDPELWTLRAVRRLEEADLVLYDALVDVRALRAVTTAQCFCVGKRAGHRSVRQDTINRVMIRAAQAGKRVVRLKGGDPFVFGRGAEEALALAMAGIAFEVVPGVSSATAAPALAGIPVTHRGIASSFLVVSGHALEAFDSGIRSVAPNSASLVVLMGLSARAELSARLVAAGWRPDTPAAVVCAASTASEWTWSGPLARLPAVEPPDGVAGVLVVGEVVRVRDLLGATVGSARAGNEVSYGRHR